ncbi:MAG: TrkH family potassium uptake protein [Saezia sp.]
MLKNFLKLARPSSDALEGLYPILRIMGFLQAGFGVLMLVPALVGWCFGDLQSTYLFLICAVAIIALGLAIGYALRHHNTDLTPRDGVLLVPLTWLWLPFISCIPLFITLHYIGRPIGFSHAYFEAVSGLSTTGNTVLTNLDSLPIALHFWRSMLQWIGGLGVIILAVAILPLLGSGAMRVLRIEMAGPLKDTKLTPRISTTAKALWIIYAIFSALCALAFWLAGMEPLDAILHMFTTISLGGLTPHDGSFAYFNNPAIELVAVFFMMLASISFVLYFTAFHKRSLIKIIQSPEAKATFFTYLFCGYLAAYLLWVKTDTTFFESLRLGFFHGVSLGSTTGFTSVDYALWPAFIPVMMLLLSGFATGAGSTGAGIKMIRMIILIKQAQHEIKRMAHPRAIHPLTIAGQIVEQHAIFAVMAFMLLYGATIFILSMVLLLTDIDLITAFSAIVASINCLGVGMGGVGPSGSFAHFDSFQIWTCTLAMLLGRLELLSFFAILMPSFWRK